MKQSSKGNSMQKILVLTNSINGLYSFRRELIEELLERDFNVIISAPIDTRTNYFREIGCNMVETNIDRRGISPISDFKLLFDYMRVINKANPDVVLTYTIKPNVYGGLACRLTGAPHIANITGLGTAVENEGILQKITVFLYRLALKKSKTVVFQNEENMDFMQLRGIGANSGKLIPGSGVNIEKFHPMKQSTKSEGIIRFLYIGRIMKDKGIEEYIASANRIAEKYSNTEFQILGSYEEEQYRELIEENPNIRHLGRSDDVREQIREVDCIVHPSYHEGMSNVLLEGAAMGKPLLASNIPGCKEIVDHGTNGYLFEPRSSDSLVGALEMFLKQGKDRWIEMGMKSRQKVEAEFDRNFVIQAYLQAISEITDGK